MWWPSDLHLYKIVFVKLRNVLICLNRYIDIFGLEIISDEYYRHPFWIAKMTPFWIIVDTTLTAFPPLVLLQSKPWHLISYFLVRRKLTFLLYWYRTVNTSVLKNFYVFSGADQTNLQVGPIIFLAPPWPTMGPP